jgi:probable addiction module antidote protein
MAETLNTTPFDVADYLTSDEHCLAYLQVVMEENDTEYLMKALGDIARARSMAKVAEATGLGRESLYKALQPGSKVRFETVQKVLNALGLKLSVEAIRSPKSAAE